jgi:uncharacterized protein YkwD
MSGSEGKNTDTIDSRPRTNYSPNLNLITSKRNYSQSRIMKYQSGSFLLLLSIFLIFFHPAGAVSNISSVDLSFTSLESAPSGAAGSPIYSWISLTNKGEQISMTGKVSIYLSPDPVITDDDYLLGETAISFIRPGASVQKGLVGTIPTVVSPGNYIIGAMVTGKSRLIRDADESDNVIAANTVTVTRSFKRPQEWYNSRISDLVYGYTNEEREKRNLGELNRDSDLDVIARDMSQDMADRKFFDHTNPDGENPIDRAERHGYTQLRYLPDGKEFAGISENIVKIPVGDVFRFGDINPDDPDQIARVAIRSFLDSPTHKATLLLPEFEVIGLGTAFDGKDYYITQNFF